MQRMFRVKARGYDPSEVESYIERLKKDFEEDLARQKDRLLELRAENKLLSEELAEFRDKENQIVGALVEAQCRASAVEREAKERAERQLMELEGHKRKLGEEMADTRARLLNLKKAAADVLGLFVEEIEQEEKAIAGPKPMKQVG